MKKSLGIALLIVSAVFLITTWNTTYTQTYVKESSTAGDICGCKCEARETISYTLPTESDHTFRINGKVFQPRMIPLTTGNSHAVEECIRGRAAGAAWSKVIPYLLWATLSAVMAGLIIGTWRDRNKEPE